jgi:hypothetical protein
MGYRELTLMEIVEVVRQWQAGVSQRGIAQDLQTISALVNSDLQRR